MRSGPSMSQAAVYAEFRKLMDMPRAELVRMFQRQNGTISRSHRYEAGVRQISQKTPAEKIRESMVEMAELSRVSTDPGIREQAVRLYDELHKALRKADLGLPDEA